jgi:lactobin A/cerein 7B family class IIb bacteriocin
MKNSEFMELDAQELKGVNGGGVFVAGIIIGVLIAEMLDRNAGSDFEEGRQAFRNSH